MLTPRRGAPPHIWTGRFTVIFLVNVIISFGQFMTLTLVPKFAESLGATAVMVGVVTGLFAVTALSVRPAVGPATLRIRHNYLLAATVATILAAFLMYALADDLTLLLVARLLHGAGMGFLAPVTLAMASNALPSERMAQGIGIFSLGQAASTAVGPSVGLALLGLLGYRPTFLIGAALMLIAAVCALRAQAPPATSPGTERTRGWSSFVAAEAVIPAVVMFFLAGAFSGVNAFIVLYGEARGVHHIGLFFTAYAVFILLSRPLAGRLADTKGLSVVIVPGMIVFGLAFVVISHVSTLTGFVIAGALSALGYGVCQPAIQTLCLMSVDPERRGVASNVNYVGVDLGYLIIPIVGGWAVTRQIDAGSTVAEAYSTMYLALTLPIAVGLLVYLLFLRSRRVSVDGLALPEPGP